MDTGNVNLFFWIGFTTFFKKLSRVLGFDPPLSEQLLKDMPEPQFCEKVHRMICEKIHMMIAIHALGVQPNKTANL